jgi:hypothetical protein
MGDLSSLAHNEWTLCLWAVDLIMQVSKKTKRALKSTSIEQRISLFKGLLSHRYGFAIAGAAPRLSNLIKDMKVQDPLGGARKKRRGLRHRHLAKVWKKHVSVRQRTATRLSEWAALATARHTLARGGELAHVMRGDLTFHVMPKSGRRYAVLCIRPLKKRAGQAQPKVPQMIGDHGDPDGGDAYNALRRLTEARIWPGDPGTTPLFRNGAGKPISTDQYRALVKRTVLLLGQDPKHFGAHSTRIGGATDLASTGRASQLLLQAKGRWASDIAAIYARMTRKQQLAVSDLMYESHGRDLEEIMPEFSQPA